MIRPFHSGPKPPNLLLIQRILPPYRLPVFQSLACSQTFSLTLAYGEAPPGSALESLPAPSGIQVRRVRNHFFLKEKVVLQEGVCALVRSRRYEVIIAEFNPRILSNLLAFMEARRRAIPFVWWGHGLRPNTGPKAAAIYRFFAKKADALILYSQEGVEGLARLGVNPQKCFVAWNSIDTERIAQLAKSTVRRTRILCIGRLIPEKKVDLLVRAFASIVTQLDEQSTLALVGDGPERSALEELADTLGIRERVEFVGSLYEQEALAPWFRSSLVCVSAGYVGLSAIHSLAYGVPMVVAREEPHSPEIAALEEGINCLFFRSNDEAALGAVILELTGDEERRAAFGRAGQEGVQSKFSIAAMVEAFEAAVTFACQARRHPGVAKDARE